MNVLVVLEQRFARTPDGAVWTDGQFPYSWWRRYLDVFDQAHVVARVREVEMQDPGWLRTDGPDVIVKPVPYYQGMWQYLRKAGAIRGTIRDFVTGDDAVMLRIGSQLANIMHPKLTRIGQPFGVEVVADPYDAFAPGAIRHPLRSYFRWHFTRTQQRQCREASAAAYVTNEFLQQRYPASKTALSVAYSSVALPDEAFADTARSHTLNSPLKLVTVGTLSQRHKRIDVLIEAVQQLNRAEFFTELCIVGDGQYRDELEALAKRLGMLDSHIRFAGQLAGAEAVRRELDRADMFVMPSRHEGLPRAIIEAMAIGLPCIGTRVGGIPELLDEDCLVDAGSADILASKIREIASQQKRLDALSVKNLEVARGYRESILQQRRNKLYQRLRDVTQRWQETGSTNRPSKRPGAQA